MRIHYQGLYEFFKERAEDVTAFLNDASKPFLDLSVENDTYNLVEVWGDWKQNDEKALFGVFTTRPMISCQNNLCEKLV